MLFCLERGRREQRGPAGQAGCPGTPRRLLVGRSPITGAPRLGSVAASGPASELPAPRPRRGAPGGEAFRGSQAWPGGARPSLHFGLCWGPPAGNVGAGGPGPGRRSSGWYPAARPLARCGLGEYRSVTQTMKTEGRELGHFLH